MPKFDRFSKTHMSRYYGSPIFLLRRFVCNVVILDPSSLPNELAHSTHVFQVSDLFLVIKNVHNQSPFRVFINTTYMSLFT